MFIRMYSVFFTQINNNSLLSIGGINYETSLYNLCKPFLNLNGYVVSKEDLHLDLKSIKPIFETPRLKTVKEIRRLIGLLSWYRKFIPDYATLLATITALLKKGRAFTYTKKCAEILVN